ncbi:MAG: trehalase-like domain-containing protein [Syntrophobacteraceae bacterium]
MTPTLRQFAFIADGERGALVGPSGEIAWMCMPSWESEAVFTALLGGRGACIVRPQERFVWGGYYEPGTLIWKSRWVLAGGAIVECREALAFPEDPDRAVLLRRISPREGAAKTLVRLDLWKSYGSKRFENVKRSDSGIWTADAEGLFARWTGVHALLLECASRMRDHLEQASNPGS